MPSTTVNSTNGAIETNDESDIEFARGAARYLRRSGLTDEAIAVSLVDELGVDLTDARNITLTL